MGKHFCDYCDVFLTHDSTSVRKAHNSGRNHLQNVRDYYQSLESAQIQSIVNSICKQYEQQGMEKPKQLNQPVQTSMMTFGAGPLSGTSDRAFAQRPGIGNGMSGFGGHGQGGGGGGAGGGGGGGYNRYGGPPNNGGGGGGGQRQSDGGGYARQPPYGDRNGGQFSRPPPPPMMGGPFNHPSGGNTNPGGGYNRGPPPGYGRPPPPPGGVGGGVGGVNSYGGGPSGMNRGSLPLPAPPPSHYAQPPPGYGPR